jgi:hypothetical protein
MENPKTTLSGYVGLAGTILASVGSVFAATPWGAALLAVGIALKGADSVGNILSKDHDANGAK